MVVLFFGDIFGKPGRKAVAKALPDLKARFQPDFIIGNIENLAGGRGVNKRTYQEMLGLGFHGFTSGNHIWDNKEVLSIFETDDRLLRPLNYPEPPDSPCPGKGFRLFRSGNNALMVVNVMGRVFMDAIDCPFQAVDRVVKTLPPGIPVLVDMHADATSEKNAMGWYLAGRAAAVVGTHSHVQTADERILPGGTAFITDVGMNGSFDSVIGMRHDEVIKKFLTKRPHHFQQAKENPGVSAVVIQLGPDNRAQKIERIRFAVGEIDLNQEKDLE